PHGSAQSLRPQLWQRLQRFVAGEAAPGAEVSAAAQQIIEFYADAQLPERPAVGAVGWEDESEGVREMWCDLAEYTCHEAGITEDFDPALFELSQRPVEQAAGAAAGAVGEIVAIQETDPQAAHGGIARDAAADDAAAHDL